jgi:two-component system response regulator AtoC
MYSSKLMNDLLLCSYADQREDRARVIAALEDCAGNQTRAAKLLGVGRSTLVNKLGLYRIPRPRT